MKRAILFGFARLMRKLDFADNRRVAAFFGFLMWALLWRRRRDTIARIRRHLDLPEEAARRIAKASFYSTAASFMEIFLNDRLDMRSVTVRDPELFEAMMRPGQCGILATAHFGSWELMGALISQNATRPTMTVARKQKDPVVSDLIRDLRAESKLRAVDHRAASGPALECMRQQGLAGFLVDHNTKRKEAVFLPFFNDTAAVNVGPALLAVRAKALVYPVFLRRDGLKQYTLCLHAPLDTTMLEGPLSDRVRQVAAFYTKAVEKQVREAPEQWLWMHRRWKTRPPDSPDFPNSLEEPGAAGGA